MRLGCWGARSPWLPRDAALSVDFLILLFRTMFDPCAAEELKASYELRLGEDRFRAVVDDGRFEITRGDDDRPDVTIETNRATLAAVVYDGLGIEEALR